MRNLRIIMGNCWIRYKCVIRVVIVWNYFFLVYELFILSWFVDKINCLEKIGLFILLGVNFIVSDILYN